MISVIIPAYNAQAYLRECLESVLAQTYTDWEAVIVDDGSTDSTLAIASSYAGRDSRFKVVSIPNRGLASARNAGIGNACGEWLAYVDSDDTLHPKALERLNGVALNAGVDIVVGQYTQRVNEQSVTCAGAEIITGRRACEACLYQSGITTSACAKLFRRDVVDGIRFPDGMYYEDILYCVESFRKSGRVAVIPDKIYYYRDNPTSIINTFTPKRLDVLRITAMVEELSADEPDLSRAARDRRLSANFNLFGLLSVYDREGRYSDIRRQCWEIIRSYRHESMRNHRVRLKNKTGILLSYFGKRIFSIASRLVY